MALEKLGTDYGCSWVDPDYVWKDSVVISAGVGPDISFDVQLIKKCGCDVLGIDPSDLSVKTVADERKKNPRIMTRYRLDRKALADKPGKVKVYRSKHASESTLGECELIDPKRWYMVEGVALKSLIEKYGSNLSLIKLDIEGGEFEIMFGLGELKVPQFTVEFHHRSVRYTEKDTNSLIAKMTQDFGYRIIQRTEVNRKVSFLHKDAKRA